MFGMLGSLAKATVGVVVQAPIALVADVVDLGGALTDRPQPRTVDVIEGVLKNLNDAADPKKM